MRIPRKRSIHALLSHSTHFWHRPRSFGKVIFLSILYTQNLLHTCVHELGYVPKGFGRSFLVIACMRDIGLYTHRRTDGKYKKTGSLPRNLILIKITLLALSDLDLSLYIIAFEKILLLLLRILLDLLLLLRSSSLI